MSNDANIGTGLETYDLFREKRASASDHTKWLTSNKILNCSSSSTFVNKKNVEDPNME